MMLQLEGWGRGLVAPYKKRKCYTRLLDLK
jgi:hypothetical protein